jgi:hypothetical protein
MTEAIKSRYFEKPIGFPAEVHTLVLIWKRMLSCGWSSLNFKSLLNQVILPLLFSNEWTDCPWFGHPLLITGF